MRLAARCALIGLIVLGINAESDFDRGPLGTSRLPGIEGVSHYSADLSAKFGCMFRRPRRYVAIFNGTPNVEKRLAVADGGSGQV